MQQTLQQILSELRSAWRFRWWGAGLAWAAFAAGFCWIVFQPNIYEARARVYIDTSSVLRPYLSNQIVARDIGTELQYVRQALLGREQLLHVANAAGLDVGAVTPAQIDTVVNELRSGVRLQSTGATRNSPDNLYQLTYRNTNREVAMRVVSELLDSMVEDTLGASRRGTATAQQFIDERIAEYEQRLQRAELALADFKRRNADRLPGAEGGYFVQIQQERAQLEEAQKALRLAESRRNRLIEQLASENPVVPSLERESEPPPNSIDARIRDSQRELDDLLLRNTENHPDVIAVRERLERLEAQRVQQLQAMGVQGGIQSLSGLDANPVHQALRIAINEAEVEIASLQADVEERSGKLAALQALMDEVPEVEAELARLNRDYDIVYEQYHSLVRSRETQLLSSQASDADQIEFRVIEPPLASFEPVAPDRLRLLAMAFFGAVMVGGGVCWLLAQIRPVFSTTAKLRDVVGLPVLGAVSEAHQARHRVRRGLAFVSFVGVMGVLFAVFVLGALIEVAGPGLNSFTRFF